jgi:hypothetical protein
MAEALRMEDVPRIMDNANAELRRLHAENASLAAALASSCDEQRHELWESGGIAGCERARVAERQRDALLEALRSIEGCCDEEHAARDYASRQAEIRGIARAAIKAVEEGK